MGFLRRSHGTHRARSAASLRESVSAWPRVCVDRVRGGVAHRTTAMVESSAVAHFGTRRRALAPAAVGLAALGGMFTMVSQNALAVNFTSVDTAYKVYTNKITGTYGAGFIDEQQTKSAGKVAVSEIGFASAQLNGLCAIAQQTLPTVGPVSLVVRAGETVDGSLDPANPTPVTATSLFFSSPTLMGTGDEIATLNLGQSADTVTMNGATFPAPMQPTAGAFGLQARTLTISNLRADSYGIDLQGAIKLPNLRIEVVTGSKAYADCATLPTGAP